MDAFRAALNSCSSRHPSPANLPRICTIFCSFVCLATSTVVVIDPEQELDGAVGVVSHKLSEGLVVLVQTHFAGSAAIKDLERSINEEFLPEMDKCSSKSTA